MLGDSAERNVSVYLPPEYDKASEKRYPVLYLLHGYTGTNELWTGDKYIKGLNIARIADELINAPFIPGYNLGNLTKDAGHDLFDLLGVLLFILTGIS